MSRIRRLPGRRSPSGSRGFALMLVLLLIGAGVGAALLSFFSPNTLTLESDQKTADALAQVKAALIAYAVTRGGITGADRPGEFPCPDTNAPGTAFYGLQNGTCGGGAVALGRVPWRTLGIPEPKDSAGETLWYAVANPFRRNPPNAGVINSDTRGNIIVYAADGVTPLTTEAVAVIFAPGRAVGGQTRGGANQNIATNYLETSNGIDNADPAPPTGPFIAGRLRAPNNPNYNDRLLYITTREFMPAVEMRVVREIRVALEGYRANSACQCYPWADTWPRLSGSFNSDVGVNRGRFPLDAYPESWSPSGTVPPAGSIPSLPTWFGANEWQDVLYYSVGRQHTNLGGALCTFCSPSAMLSVDGNAVSALIMTPGTPGPGINRPNNTLADYLKDAQNNDGGQIDMSSVCPTPPELGSSPYVGVPPVVPASCDTYVTPTSKAVDRNRMVTFISAGVPQTCAQNAAALLPRGPCGPPPRLKPQCVTLALNLAVCSPVCAAAANVMITVPCMNTFNAKACQTAVAQLKAC